MGKLLFKRSNLGLESFVFSIEVSLGAFCLGVFAAQLFF